MGIEKYKNYNFDIFIGKRIKTVKKIKSLDIDNNNIPLCNNKDVYSINFTDDTKLKIILRSVGYNDKCASIINRYMINTCTRFIHAEK